MSFATIKVSHYISEERVRDLLCSAWEGGSSYWCSCIDRQVPPAALATIAAIKAERLDKTGDGCFYSHEYPFINGVTLVLTADEEETTSRYTLTGQPWFAACKSWPRSIPVNSTIF